MGDSFTADQLQERIKELDCIYKVTEATACASDVGALLAFAARQLPQAWRFPDTAVAVVTLDAVPFPSRATFESSPWRQRAELNIEGTVRGWVDVYYTEEQPSADEGPFLEMERRLIDAVALCLSQAIGRIEQHNALRASEQRLNSLVRNLDDMVYFEGADGVVEHFNAGATRISGYPQAAFKKDPQLWQRIIHPDDFAAADKHMREADPDKVVIEVEYRLRHHDGKWRWIQSRLTPLKGDDGELVGYYGIDRDITSLKEAIADREEYQRFMKALLRAIPVPVFYKDLSGRYLGCNRALLETVGIAEDDFVGKTTADINAAERVPEYRAQDERVITKGGIQTFDSAIRFIDGTWHDVIFTKALFHDAQGKPAGIVGAFVDVTDRNRNLRELLRLNSTLEAIREIHRVIVRSRDPRAIAGSVVQTLTSVCQHRYAPVILCDEHGTVYHTTSAGEPVAGALATDGAPQPWQEDILQGKRRGDTVNAAAEAVIPDGDNAAVVGVGLSHGSRVWGCLTLVNCENHAFSDAEVRFIEEIAEDVALGLHQIALERDKAETLLELRKAHEEAESASRAKGEFLAMMSHELRTPLNPVLGFGSILLEQLESPEQREFARMIVGGCARLERLVDNILTYTSIDRDSGKRLLEDFCPLDVVKLVATQARETAGDLTVAVENGIPGDLEPIDEELLLFGDRDAFMRVLTLLTANAVKYTPAGGVTVRCGLRKPVSSMAELVFEVADTGIGINLADVNRLFEPFEQDDTTLRRGYEGAGLGLAIVGKLLKLLEGWVYVWSEPGRGSTFRVYITLPRSGTAEEAAASPAVRPLPGPCHTLLVDDREDNLLVTRILLERMGATVEPVSDGHAALEATQEPFDLIITDLTMPGLDGLELSRRIRASDGPNARTPILALTAIKNSRVETDCATAGIDAFIVKPANPVTLHRKIRRLVFGC